jgi:hypothetical protein
MAKERKRAEGGGQEGQSRKIPVIEALFEASWDDESQTVSKSLVTLKEVLEAIKVYNADCAPGRELGEGNAANFMKDLIRNKRSANRNWPQSVFARGYTARQVTGENACFEFIPLAPGQTEPFPLNVIPAPTDAVPRHRVESASMPLASRRLGRKDESWLMQVLVRLRVFETHLSLFSGWQVVQMDLLQLGVKQRRTEIDGLFLAVEEVEGDDNESEPATRELLVCCEAKSRRDDILEDQILSQVRAVFRMKAITQDVVVPMAAKTVGPSQVHVLEFEAVTREAAPTMESLVIASEAVYEFVPPVPGVR